MHAVSTTNIWKGRDSSRPFLVNFISIRHIFIFFSIPFKVSPVLIIPRRSAFTEEKRYSLDPCSLVSHEKALSALMVHNWASSSSSDFSSATSSEDSRRKSHQFHFWRKHQRRMRIYGWLCVPYADANRIPHASFDLLRMYNVHVLLPCLNSQRPLCRAWHPQFPP